jgi:hypothetical protein
MPVNRRWWSKKYKAVFKARPAQAVSSKAIRRIAQEGATVASRVARELCRLPQDEWCQWSIRRLRRKVQKEYPDCPLLLSTGFLYNIFERALRMRQSRERRSQDTEDAILRWEFQYLL